MSVNTMTTKKHEVPEELLSSLLADYKKPEDLIGENGLLKQLTKLLVEKALDAELTEWLRKANAARDEAAKRAAESDAERASKAGEGANGPATAGGARPGGDRY